jgi:hypothetical protein
MLFGFYIVLNITIMLIVTKYPYLKRQWLFPFYVDALFPESLPILDWTCLHIGTMYFTGLDYIWVQMRVSNKKQKYLVQKQANENKNTENWKMGMNTIDKTALTEVLVNVGQNGWFTSTFLDMFCLIFVFKHSINYEINKMKNARILYIWGF